jgi:acyl-CoA thioesterase-1
MAPPLKCPNWTPDFRATAAEDNEVVGIFFLDRVPRSISVWHDHDLPKLVRLSGANGKTCLRTVSCLGGYTQMNTKRLALGTMIFIISWLFQNDHDTTAAAKSDQKAMIVAAFGTSLTHQAGWLQPLEKKLTRCLGRQVTVLDFGRSGASSEWGVTAVGAVIRSRPDVVLVEFSANDAAWFKGFSLRRSQENTTQIVRAIKEALPTAKIFLMTMNPVFGPRGWIRPNIDAYYDMYKLLADELGVGYIDNRKSWNGLTNEELRAGIPDGAHPLPDLAARILVPTLARAIGSGTCR